MSAPTTEHCSRLDVGTDIIAGLTEPQRACLLADDNDEVEAGIGTWLLLREKGLLDAQFNRTFLGRLVRSELSKAVSP